ncbi:MAG TPA: DNA polymerase III subunit delta', partial [Thermohalobaculum sp.]|nr:DNA polymerase III subunit delta' [Thermohalobaculum sp.]
VELADAASARGAETTYALIVELTLLLTGRLARAAATGGLAEPVAGEGPLAAAVAARPAQAPLWAEAATRIAAATSHARAVNLDPGQTIMDTFLDLDATLARAGAAG